MGALLDLALGADIGYDLQGGAFPVDTVRQGRIDKAVEKLNEVPSRRAAFVAGEESDDMVSVTIVIRTVLGLATGELAIPRRRWDPVLFLNHLAELDREKLS
jgi:hypothetical protein